MKTLIGILVLVALSGAAYAETRAGFCASRQARFQQGCMGKIGASVLSCQESAQIRYRSCLQTGCWPWESGPVCPPGLR